MEIKANFTTPFYTADNVAVRSVLLTAVTDSDRDRALDVLWIEQREHPEAVQVEGGQSKAGDRCRLNEKGCIGCAICSIRLNFACFDLHSHIYLQSCPEGMNR